MTNTTGGVAFMVATGAGPDSYAALSTSMTCELNKRPAFRRRLMLRDGRVDYFEVVQLVRHLQQNLNRTAEQEILLNIVQWVKTQVNQSTKTSTTLMLFDICTDSSLPQRFAPIYTESLSYSERNELWAAAKQYRVGAMSKSFQRNQRQDATPGMDASGVMSPQLTQSQDKRELLERRKTQLFEQARLSLQSKGLENPNIQQVFTEVLRLGTNQH